MKSGLALLCILLFSTNADARSKKKPLLAQEHPVMGFSLAGNGNTNNLSVQASQYWQIHKNNSHVSVGLGARFTGSLGNKNPHYETAQIDLRRESNFIFSQQVAAHIDTLQLQQTQTNTLNAMLSLRYSRKKYDVALDMDIAGFGFGPTQEATLFFGEQSEASRLVLAKPAPRNLLLLGDNNVGNLHSTLSVNYHYRTQWDLCLGISQLRCEYRIDKPVLYTASTGIIINTDRYRQTAVGILLGTRYHFHAKKS